MACHSCGALFGIFSWEPHWCRVCGKHFCCECMKSTAADICSKCAKRRLKPIEIFHSSNVNRKIIKNLGRVRTKHAYAYSDDAILELKARAWKKEANAIIRVTIRSEVDWSYEADGDAVILEEA